MNLATFLRARLDEEEAAARRWPEEQMTWQVAGNRALIFNNGAREDVSAINVSGESLGWERVYVKRDINGLAEHIVRHDPATVLADVAGRRRILGWADSPALPEYERSYVLGALAERYAAHPDYQPEWHPAAS